MKTTETLEYLKICIKNAKAIKSIKNETQKEAAKVAIKTYFFVQKALNLQILDTQFLLQQINNAFNINFTKNDIKLVEKEIKQTELQELQELQNQLQKQQYHQLS